MQVTRMPFVRGSLLLSAAAAFLIATAGPGATEMIVKKSTSYFTITGSTADELDQSLIKHGPLTHNTGLRHPGATRIKFGGAVTYVEKDGRCSIGKVTVTLTTDIILPQWIKKKHAPADLRLIWNTLAADIKRHEERHAEIARTHARDMEKTLLALYPEKNCTALEEKVSVISMTAVEAHDKDQARFDTVEAKNFESRMIRLLTYRLKSAVSAN